MATLGRSPGAAPLTSADIPDNSITAAKIVADTIAAGDLAPNSVDSSELVDGSIDTSHIADDQVTGAKLANDIAISTTGAITTTGAFTSIGIDDNADANTIKIDANENVGIGVTPRTDWVSTRTGLQIGPRSVLWGESGNNNTLLSHNVYETSSGYAGIADGPCTFFLMSAGEMNYRTGTNSAGAGGTVSMTNRFAINSAGHVAMATDSNLATTPSTARGLWLKGNLPSWGILGIQTQITTGTVKAIAFQDGDGDDCGELVVNAATNAVSLSTTSDYRLKENVIEMSGSITKLKSLKPKYFSFIKDPGKRVFGGFLALEVSDIVPEAVHGEKDAMRMDEYEVTPAVDEVRDKDGNITTEAVPAVMGEREIISQQNMDQSKLVPLLVGALQEAIARIEALESA